MPPRSTLLCFAPLRMPKVYIVHPQCRYYSSVDPSEVSHFNALAADWWDPAGSCQLLHLMNPLRIQFLRSCLARGSSLPLISTDSPQRGMRYLDVGCGGGILAESLARLRGTQQVVAIDPTPGVLNVARKHARQDPMFVGNCGRLTYLDTTIGRLQEAMKTEGMLQEDEHAQFDVVTTMEVVEHVSQPTVFLRECMDHVRPGGWVVGSTIARTWVSWLTTIAIAEDVLGVVPKGTHDWKKYVNPEELEEFFRTQAGWGEARFIGCAYVPGLGWQEVPVQGGERLGNYFFGVRRLPES